MNIKESRHTNVFFLVYYMVYNLRGTEILFCCLHPYVKTDDSVSIIPLSPHDALKHHFTSLKTDLIFLQLEGLERRFP